MKIGIMQTTVEKGSYNHSSTAFLIKVKLLLYWKLTEAFVDGCRPVLKVVFTI